MRRTLRVLIAVSLLVTVLLGSAGGVAADMDLCSVDGGDDDVTQDDMDLCSADGGVTIMCGGGGGGGGGGGC